MAKKTADDFVAKGWTRLDLVAGQAADVAHDPDAQSVKVLKGQMFDAAGDRLKGRRPRLTVVESDAGSAITSSADVTVLYKLVDDEQDEDDEVEVDPIL